MKKPEEIIVAALGGLWVVLTWLIASYFGMPGQTALLITVLTLVWVAVFFFMWSRHRLTWIWPIFMGLFVACWWPGIDWLAIKDIVASNAQTDTIVLSRPWYDTWSAKFVWAGLPIVLGYAYIIYQYYQRRQDRLRAPIELKR